MSKDEVSALQVMEATFPVLSQGAAEILAVVEENLRGEQISPFDLEQIKVPGGGSLSWQLSGGGEEKEISGVVVYHSLKRGRWETTIEESGGGQPPVCSSEDSLIGHGDPGGDCLTCPYAQWESAEKGGGQACKQRRLMFLLREGSLLPDVVAIPAKSLKNAKDYLVRLVKSAIPLPGVVTKITLERTTNAAGTPCARAVFARGERLTPEQTEQMKAYADSMRAIFSAVQIEHTGPPSEGEDV